VLIVAMITFALPSFAAINVFTEHFTTTVFKDTVNTTADWDTTSGELKLFPFVPTLSGLYSIPAVGRAQRGGTT
jgi:hypothetical protein